MTKMLKNYAIAILAIVFAIPAFAQQGSVNIAGSVVDETTGEPIIGASVSIASEKSGAVSDLDGAFTLRVKALPVRLSVSFLGYKTFEVDVYEYTKPLKISLRENIQFLEEVVVTVPYGTAKKSTFTGSAGVVSGATIEKSQGSNISKALQGAVAGLQSFSQSGQPGSDATIRIRGVGSVNASNNPLYVVDGAPYDGTLSSIASSDIESISILKDATAATLYGSRAGNGVIMITTKSGKNQAPEVSITSKFGVSSRASRDYDQLNTDQYFELTWEALRNNRLDNGLTPEAAAAYASSNLIGRLGINPYGTGNPEPVGVDGKLKAGLSPLWDDNWIDALSQDAYYTDINVQVNGGSATSKYFVSAGYLNDQGIAIESGFKRYSFRTNVVSDIKKWLQVGLNASASLSTQDYPKQDDSNTVNLFLASRLIPSFYPVYERDRATGAYLLDDNGDRIPDYGKYRASSFSNQNLKDSQPRDLHQIKRDALSARGYVQAEPVAGLQLKSSLNVDYNSRFDHDYANPVVGEDAEYGGYSAKSNGRTIGLTNTNTANYKATFNDIHKLSILAGHEYYEYNYATFGGERDGVIADGFYEPSAASVLTSFSGSSDQYKLLSFFGSADYSYNNKYFLSASVRSDASSRFFKENRWGTFWSVGASWRIIEEDFLASAKDNFLSNLSIRASYGSSGNDNLGSGSNYYAWQALYSISSNLGEGGLRPSRLENKNLTWESNLNLNLGLDFGFFNNRLNGSLEYFDRTSKDLLFSRALIASTGFSSITENIGKVKNYGWELTLEGYPVYTKDWKWKLGVNVTTYKNEIVSLPQAEMWSGQKKWVKGGSLYDFYLIEWAGVNPENGKPQWYRYKDGEKIKTEDYSSAVTSDKVKSGNSLPDFSGGFQSALTYKDFTLDANFAYVLGGHIYNRDNTNILHLGNAPGTAWSADVLNRWTPENTNTDIPRLTTVQSSSFTSESTRFLIDRSYLRLKTLTFSYALPKSILKNISIKSVSLFVQGENLLTFTKQQGIDPEQTFDGTTYWRYPAMKTFSFGFNIKL
ncbi:MAG: TonB-dependent receptor [Dysgonamonadaceae bacterium]|jgi:TonB-linked SusC/RagA family outer membrane protein|nr:TonB-dependent receptor [Dysgonamonadaceae bacterium]